MTQAKGKMWQIYLWNVTHDMSEKAFSSIKISTKASCQPCYLRVAECISMWAQEKVEKCQKIFSGGEIIHWFFLVLSFFFFSFVKMINGFIKTSTWFIWKINWINSYEEQVTKKTTKKKLSNWPGFFSHFFFLTMKMFGGKSW